MRNSLSRSTYPGISVHFYIIVPAQLRRIVLVEVGNTMVWYGRDLLPLSLFDRSSTCYLLSYSPRENVEVPPTPSLPGVPCLKLKPLTPNHEPRSISYTVISSTTKAWSSHHQSEYCIPHSIRMPYTTTLLPSTLMELKASHMNY